MQYKHPRFFRSVSRSPLLVNLASRRFLHKAIPPKPLDVSTELPELKKIDQDTILQLERVALVNLGNEEGARRLAAAIQLADTIAKVDTKGVQPLYTVLEDRALFLADDEVLDGDIRKEVTANASVIEEDYFVAPPGNIPLDQTDKK